MTFLLAAGLISTAARDAWAFQGGEGAGKCADCHTLTVDEAGKLLMVERFKAKVTDVRDSPIKGVWEVELSQVDRKIILYIDYSKKHLIEGAEFTELAKLSEIAEQQRQQQKVVDLKTIPLGNAVVLGDAKAVNKVIVFDDPDCPYCRQLDKDIAKILETRKDIVFYIKLLPLSMHPNARGKSLSILCNGKSAQLLADAMADKKMPKGECKTAELDDNAKLAAAMGISGTPGIILPDGRLIPGFVPAETLLNFIDNPSADK